MQVDHWMTFSTFAEQRFFIYPTPETYKGVIINANMVAHAPDGIAAFLLEKTKSANFIIDPLTHAFQHDIKYIMSGKTSTTSQIKSSIKKLAEAYSHPFINQVGKRSISPEDFQNKNERKKMVDCCINFQRNKLQQSGETNDISKYLSQTESQLRPYAIIPPYFFLTEINYKDWISVMKKCLIDALDLKQSDERLFVSIVISDGVLSDQSTIDKIIAHFHNIDGLDGFLVWVDDFNEQKVSISQLTNFKYLCEKLRNKSNEVINLHGGYFSVLMAGNLGGAILSGVAHGPEFGEYRSVIPVGGGIPIAKYYIPKLHSRVKYRDASYLLKELGWLENSDVFYKNVCKCIQCKNVIQENIDNFSKFGDTKTKARINKKGEVVMIEYPFNNTKEICLRHYLNSKKTEYKDTVRLDKQQLISNLKESQNLFKKVAGINLVSYLEKWQKVFNS